MSAAQPLKVCIVGSGNWGSAIARIVGETVKVHDKFDNTVKMWVFEEMVEGQKLTEIINSTHENRKYLPGKQLPTNIVAVPDVVESTKDADILIFVVPHQFVEKLCQQIASTIKPTALGISLIKGLATRPDGGIQLISEIIHQSLKIPVSVLMGANLAHEVADEKFCEATVGAKNKDEGALFKDLFQTHYFRIVTVQDANTVELCGALKNVVACGAGFADGLSLGDNTKAAVIRLGLMEMIKFIAHFYPGSALSTFFESCGVADLVTTCYGGRNRKVCEAFVKTGKTIDQLETDMLGGQKLQGPHTAEQVDVMLKSFKLEQKFPLFNAIHRICIGELKATDFVDCLRNHPEHL